MDNGLEKVINIEQEVKTSQYLESIKENNFLTNSFL